MDVSSSEDENLKGTIVRSFKSKHDQNISDETESKLVNSLQNLTQK
jgi:hypothetical protein